MPITQDRMIALINAGLDFEQAVATAAGVVAKAVAEFKGGIISAEQALGDIEIRVTRNVLLQQEARSLATLMAERQHFKSNASRNRANAKWQAKKRGPSASSLPSSAPASLLSRAVIPEIVRGLELEAITKRPMIRAATRAPDGSGSRISEADRRRIMDEATAAAAGPQDFSMEDDEPQGGEADEALPDHGEAFGVDLLGKGDSETGTETG